VANGAEKFGSAQSSPETKLNMTGAIAAWEHGEKTVEPGEEYGADDEPPAELSVGQSPRFPGGSCTSG
jgi:hypothetical protein